MKFFINARFLTQPISGVQRYAIECSRQIKALYPQVVFLCPPHIMHQSIAEELEAIPVGHRKGHLWEQLDLPSYLKKQGDAVLLNLANTAPLSHKNNFVVIHDLAFHHHPEWNSRLFAMWYNYLVPRLAKRSRHIFTVSETIKGELVKYYGIPESKVSVTYNGVGERMLIKQRDVPKKKIILSVGTFNIRKNQHTLVKAFMQSSIKDEYILVLAGDRNKVFAESGITEDIASDRIKIYEKLSDVELMALYQQAEVVVSLSNYEGFGIPIIEGLFFGCKILCSDIPVYRELFSEAAVFCKQNDVTNVATQLERVVTAVAPSKDDVDVLLMKYSYKKAAELIVTQFFAVSRKAR
jgi:glycosyltransferase involved in cell wall biosynthesis